jgi:hypothetical protein
MAFFVQLKNMDGHMNQSTVILRNMVRRIWQNKILVGFICLFLLGAIVLIIYLQVR